MDAIMQGDVFDVDLNGSIGFETTNSEPVRCRPCVIIQYDTANQRSGTTIVVPLTGSVRSRPYPSEVVVDTDDLKMPNARKSTIKCSQIRTIDKTRIRARRGRISDKALKQVQAAILTTLGVTANEATR